METVLFKPLSESAILPCKADEGSAGFDLYAPINVLIPSGRSVVKLKFAIELPHLHKAVIDPRSGFTLKGFEGYSDATFEGGCKRYDADVKHGLIDESYRGEVGVLIINRDKPFFLKRGTRFAQMVISKYSEVEFKVVDELSETSRGVGGFGHSGTTI